MYSVNTETIKHIQNKNRSDLYLMIIFLFFLCDLRFEIRYLFDDYEYEPKLKARKRSSGESHGNFTNLI